MMAANRIIRDMNTLSAENRQKFAKGCTVDQKFGGKIRSPASPVRYATFQKNE